MKEIELPGYIWKDHIRLRPAMYIGSLDFTGFRRMLEYLFESILEDFEGSPTFKIYFYSENKIRINISGLDAVAFHSKLNKVIKSGDRLFDLGLGVLIALSSDLLILINNFPALSIVHGEKENIQIEKKKSKEDNDNILIDFVPDKEIFKDYTINYEYINIFLRQFAFLNRSLKIISIDNTSEELQRNIFYYPDGIFSELDLAMSKRSYRSSSSFRIAVDTQVDDFSYQIIISNGWAWPEKSFISTYAGNIETYFGGSLQDGILEALYSAIKEIAKDSNKILSITKKKLLQHLIIIAAVRGKGLVFEGATKSKLGMPKIKKDAKKIVSEILRSYFRDNPDKATYFLNDLS
jgi:DNA gyrase/topoisomerase IV subunit B